MRGQIFFIYFNKICCKHTDLKSCCEDPVAFNSIQPDVKDICKKKKKYNSALFSLIFFKTYFILH